MHWLWIDFLLKICSGSRSRSTSRRSLKFRSILLLPLRSPSIRVTSKTSIAEGDPDLEIITASWLKISYSLLIEPKQPADQPPTSDMRQLFGWASRSAPTPAPTALPTSPGPTFAWYCVPFISPHLIDSPTHSLFYSGTTLETHHSHHAYNSSTAQSYSHHYLASSFQPIPLSIAPHYIYCALTHNHLFCCLFCCTLQIVFHLENAGRSLMRPCVDCLICGREPEFRWKCGMVVCTVEMEFILELFKE